MRVRFVLSEVTGNKLMASVTYPFAAIVGQEQLKHALLLSAVDALQLSEDWQHFCQK